jgi:hypothetical protein
MAQHPAVNRKGKSGSHLDQHPAVKVKSTGSHLDQNPNVKVKSSGSYLDQHPAVRKGNDSGSNLEQHPAVQQDSRGLKGTTKEGTPKTPSTNINSKFVADRLI